MCFKVVYLIFFIISLTTAGNNEQNDATGSECSDNIAHKCATSDINSENGNQVPDKISIEQDITIESEEVNSKEKLINREETVSIWDQVHDYASTHGKLLTYSIICIVVFSLRGRLMNIMNFGDTGKKEIKNNQDVKEGIMLGNKLIFPGELVRPLDRLEIMYAIGATQETFGTHQAIYLRSKTPIDENVMINALVELTRKMPLLQLCLKFTYFRFWFKRVDKMEIDFTTVESDDVLSVFRNETNFIANIYQGPLWRATLVKCSPMMDQPNDRNFKSVLIFSISHCITDGFTNSLICSEIVRLYNLLICKKPIPPTPMILSLPLGDNYPSYSFLKFMTMFPLLYKDAFLNVFNVRCMSPKHIVESRMKIAAELDQLTEEETSRLLKICKSKNLTVHSVVSTIAAYAYVQTAHEFSGSTLTQLKVGIMHFINLRRYITNGDDKPAGAYVSADTVIYNLDLKKGSDFWKEAQKSQNTLQSHLSNKEPLLLSSIYKYSWWTLPLLEWKKFVSSYEATFAHFTTTNMGNLSEILLSAKDNDSVEIYDVLRATSGLHLFIPMTITFHSFRNVLQFSQDIATITINEAPARFFFARIMALLRSACKEEKFVINS